MTAAKRGVRTVYDTLIRERAPDILPTLENLGYTYASLNREIIKDAVSHNEFTKICNEMFRHKHWVLVNTIKVCRVYFTYVEDKTLFLLKWN